MCWEIVNCKNNFDCRFETIGNYETVVRGTLIVVEKKIKQAKISTKLDAYFMAVPVSIYSRATRLTCWNGFYLRVTENTVEGSEDEEDPYSK